MIGPGRARRRRILTASFLVLCAGFAFGFAHTRVGDKIEDRVMPTLTGNTAHLLGDARANVIVFFKPGQQHSNVTLQHLAACEKEFTGKSVRWTAVVSDRFSKAESVGHQEVLGCAARHVAPGKTVFRMILNFDIIPLCNPSLIKDYFLAKSRITQSSR